MVNIHPPDTHIDTYIHENDFNYITLLILFLRLRFDGNGGGISVVNTFHDNRLP